MLSWNINQVSEICYLSTEINPVIFLNKGRAVHFYMCCAPEVCQVEFKCQCLLWLVRLWCHSRQGCSCVLCVCLCTCVFLLWCVQCVNKAEQEGIGAYRKEMVKGQHPFSHSTVQQSLLGLQSWPLPHHLHTGYLCLVFVCYDSKFQECMRWICVATFHPNSLLDIISYCLKKEKILVAPTFFTLNISLSWLMHSTL